MLEKAALKRGGQAARGRRGRRVPRVRPRVVRDRRDHPGRRRLGREARMTDAAPTGAAGTSATRVDRVEDARLLTGRGTYVDDIVAARDAARVLRAQPVRPRRDPRRSTRRPRSRAPGVRCVFTAADLNPDVKEQWHTSIGPREPRDAAPAARRGRGALRRRPGRARRRRRPLRSPRTRPSSSTSTTSRCRPSSTTRRAEDADALVHEAPRLQRHRRARRACPASALDDVFASAAHVVARDDLPAGVRRRCRWRAAASSSTTRRATGELTIYAATQSPHEVRLFCSRLLGMPEHRIRVVMRDTGGGFGQKVMVQRDEMCLMLAGAEGRRAAEVGRGPAREPARGGQVAPRARRRATMAFDADGAIQAAYIDFVSGLRRVPDARGRSAPRPRSACCSPARTACRAPASRPRRSTRTPSGRTAYRGPWQFETLAREVLLDIAARQMGIDPVELRRRNLLRARRAAVREPERHDLRQHLAARDVRAGARDARLRRVPRRAGRGARRGPLPRRRRRRTTSSRRRPASAYYGDRGGDDPHRAVGRGQRVHRRRLDREQHRDHRRPAHRRRARRRHRRRQHDPGRHRGHRLRRGRGREPQRVDDRGRGARDRGDPPRAHRRHRRAQARSRGRRHRARREPGERARHARRSASRSPRSPRSRTSSRTRCRPACRPGSRRARGTRADAPVDLGERDARVHVRGRRRDRAGRRCCATS